MMTAIEFGEKICGLQSAVLDAVQKYSLLRSL